MAIFYKLRFKKNSKNPQMQGYYATVANKGLLGTDAVAEEIQRNCSMKRSDVIAVLAELSEVLKNQIQQSHSVKLDGIGIFSPGISSRIAKTPEEFKSTNIKGLKLNFLPVSFKQGKSRVKDVFAGAKVQQEILKPSVAPSPETGSGGLGA